MQKTLMISLTATLFVGYFCASLIRAIFPFLDIPFTLLWTAIFYEFLKTKVFLINLTLTLPRISLELARRVIPMAWLVLEPLHEYRPAEILTLTIGACAIAYSIVFLLSYIVYKKLKNMGIYRRIPYNFGAS